MDNEKKEFENAFEETDVEATDFEKTSLEETEVEETSVEETNVEAAGAEEADLEATGFEATDFEATGFEATDFEVSNSDFAGETEQGGIEIEAEQSNNKNKKPLYILSVAVGVILLALIAFCVCYTSGVGTKSAVNTLPPDEVSDGEIVKAEKMNIKFQNPFIDMFEGKAGTAVSALKVGDYTVTPDVFRYFVKNEGLSYEYSLYQNKKISDISKFNWNEVADKDSGLTHKELVKIKAARTLAPIAATIAEAQKRGIALSDDELKEISSFIEQVKTSYGDKLEETLKMSGYESIEQLENMRKLQTMYEKAFNAFYDDPVSYVKNMTGIDEVLSEDKITVKHILIKFPDGVSDSSEEAEKAETLKKAEEVLEKAKANVDFDSLIKEYNEDEDEGKSGYTFANDGTMVQNFADAAFKLEIGQISELVETRFGYHIIKRIDRVADFTEYAELLSKNAKVELNRKVYISTPVDIDLTEYLGETAKAE